MCVNFKQKVSNENGVSNISYTGASFLILLRGIVFPLSSFLHFSLSLYLCKTLLLAILRTFELMQVLQYHLFLLLAISIQ